MAKPEHNGTCNYGAVRNPKTCRRCAEDSLRAKALRFADEWRKIGLKGVQIVGGTDGAPLTVIGFSPQGQLASMPAQSIPETK